MSEDELAKSSEFFIFKQELVSGKDITFPGGISSNLIPALQTAPTKDQQMLDSVCASKTSGNKGIAQKG